jgi:hypothetical protein
MDDGSQYLTKRSLIRARVGIAALYAIARSQPRVDDTTVMRMPRVDRVPRPGGRLPEP